MFPLFRCLLFRFPLYIRGVSFWPCFAQHWCFYIQIKIVNIFLKNWKFNYLAVGLWKKSSRYFLWLYLITFHKVFFKSHCFIKKTHLVSLFVYAFLLFFTFLACLQVFRAGWAYPVRSSGTCACHPEPFSVFLRVPPRKDPSHPPLWIRGFEQGNPEGAPWRRGCPGRGWTSPER